MATNPITNPTKSSASNLGIKESKCSNFPQVITHTFHTSYVSLNLYYKGGLHGLQNHYYTFTS